MTAIAQLAMPTCVLPGCQSIVQDPTQPCPDCLTAFGDMLHRTATARRLTAAEVEARDAEVRAILASRRPM